VPRPIKDLDTDKKENAKEDAEKNKNTVPTTKHY
jgi:hypothetical protein